MLKWKNQFSYNVTLTLNSTKTELDHTVRLVCEESPGERFKGTRNRFSDWQALISMDLVGKLQHVLQVISLTETCHISLFFFTLSMWIIYFLAVGEDISKRSWHFWTTGFNPKSAWLPEAHLSLPWTNGSFYKWAQGISSNTNILKEDLCKTKHFFSLIEKSTIWMQQIHLTYIYVDPFMWKGGWLWLWQILV